MMGTLELSNRSVVKQINQKVKERVSYDNSAEATDKEDIGVQYIVDYHKVIKQTFFDKWEKIEKQIFDRSKEQYKDEIDASVQEIKTSIRFILKEMKKLLLDHDIQFQEKKVKEKVYRDASDGGGDEDDEEEVKTIDDHYNSIDMFELSEKKSLLHGRDKS